MKQAVATFVGLLLCAGSLASADAHHVGGFTPKDSDITLNFKQIRASAQARRFEVAVKLFDDGILHGTMEKYEKQLPPGLEDGLRASLKAGDLPGAELRLSIFLAFMARELVRNAAGRLQEQSLLPVQRWDHARRILIAAWRYYNLADFVVARMNAKASAILRVAFEDSQTYLGGMMVDPMWAAGTNAKPAEPDDEKAAAAIALMERTLGEVIREGVRVARTGGAKKFLPRP